MSLRSVDEDDVQRVGGNPPCFRLDRPLWDPKVCIAARSSFETCRLRPYAAKFNPLAAKAWEGYARPGITARPSRQTQHARPCRTVPCPPPHPRISAFHPHSAG